jgi:hypothetical protein
LDDVILSLTYNRKVFFLMALKRLAFIFVVALALPILLTACGSADPAEVEEAVEALYNEGNADKWNDVSCSDEQMSADEASALNMSGTGMTVDATCEEDGSDIKCTISFGGQTTEEITMNVDFSGKVCGSPQ